MRALPGRDQAVAIVADEAPPLARLRRHAERHVRHVDHEPVGIGEPQEAVFGVSGKIDDEARAIRIADHPHVADDVLRRAARNSPGEGGKNGEKDEAQRQSDRNRTSGAPPSPDSAAEARLR